MNFNTTMKLIQIIESTIKEYLDNDITKEDYVRAYINRINREYNGLLLNVIKNPNFEFVLGVDIQNQPIGKISKCETNTYDYIKKKLENNETNYYPVAGYYFGAKTLLPIEHWWVYNVKQKKHIEVTPLDNMRKPWCYGGVVNYDINDEILNTNNVFDIDFFKGDNTYYNYFK